MIEFNTTKLTLDDKARLTHGNGAWHTHEAGGIPAITMTDGPHGLRKQSDKNRGINDSERATCFPTASAVASSWSRQAASLIGESIAEEAIAQGVDVVLGPGLNIKRSPLCGRNFEYFSEDPFLAGELASSYVNAMQSKNVGACCKHFAVNSQETRRMTINAVVDERAMREIYLSAFERVVKNADPYAIMASYNKVNGQYATQNECLYGILRGEWGFRGLVMSDWGACYDMGAAFKAGLDLEMPDGGKFHEEMTKRAVREVSLSESDLDRACANVAHLVSRCNQPKTEPDVDYLAQHHQAALSVATESAVLLKNADGILPVDTSASVLVVGEMAEKPRFQGAGSSHVNSVCRSFLDILTDNGIDFHYEKGYSVIGDTPNVKWEEKAVEDCCKYDVILFFGGLTDDFEGEGFDRSKLDIPHCQQRLLERLHTVNPNIVFVAFGGSPFCMPWLDKTKGLLNMYLGGQAVMQAAYDLVFGKSCPSGRLAETYPVKLSDTPCYNYFANDRYVDEHRESIFVGYRYYNTFGIPTLFPFGYGLSYTQFSYSNLSVDKKSNGLTVTVTVTNDGKVSGQEVVQVYADNPDCGLMRAKRQLVAFDKVFVEAGQSVTVKLNVDENAFRVFHNGRCMNAQGKYVLSVCTDVEHPVISQEVEIDGERVRGMDKELFPEFFTTPSGSFEVGDESFYKLANQPKSRHVPCQRGEFTLLNTLEDMQSVGLIRRLQKSIKKMVIKQSPTKKATDPVAQMLYNGAMETPLISVMSVGGVPAKYVMFLLHHANKRHGKAFKALFGKI